MRVVKIMEDVEKAVGEEGVVLNELFVLGGLDSCLSVVAFHSERPLLVVMCACTKPS